MANFPNSVTTFASRSAGQKIASAHMNAVQDEINAIEDGLLNATAPLNLNSTIRLGQTYVFPTAAAASTGLALAVETISGSTHTLKWASVASSVAADGFTVSTGVLTLNQGQVKFPATQVASADANALDDYEEGTWTPVIGGATSESGQSYGTQAGTYVKVGQMVFAGFNVALSNKGTITGGVRLKGLPFSISGNAAVVIGYFAGMATNWITLTGRYQSGTAAVISGSAAAGTSVTDLAAADIGNSTEWIGYVMYRASA